MGNEAPEMPPSDMRVDPATLHADITDALLTLKRALANHLPHAAHAQVTIDHIKAYDVPPTIDIIRERPW
jgi:hypothetical protein